MAEFEVVFNELMCAVAAKKKKSMKKFVGFLEPRIFETAGPIPFKFDV